MAGIVKLLCASQFMVVLDFSIVNVALPAMEHELGFSQQNLQWVISAYALTFGGFLLLGGRAADLFGRRRVFMAGLSLFTLASLVGGLAESQWVLIAARGFQGLGGAILDPAALSILTVGLAILVAVATARTQAIAATTGNLLIATTRGFQAALAVGAGFAALGIIVALLVIRDPEFSRHRTRA